MILDFTIIFELNLDPWSPGKYRYIQMFDEAPAEALEHRQKRQQTAAQLAAAATADASSIVHIY